MRFSSIIHLLALCWGLTAATKADVREGLVNAAVREVNAQLFTEIDAVNHVTGANKKLHSFKLSNPESRAQGIARLKFEKMVKTAEKKILLKQRNAAVQTAEERVESLAMELMHRPGSLLTEQEIARIYEESDCNVNVPNKCNATERRADGICNNLQHPLFGAANTALRRLIPARYDDGISRLQGTLQIRGSSLVPGPFSPPKPSPRIVSLGIVNDREVNDTQFSHILMQWGQFMDHDLDAVPEFEGDCPSGCAIEEERCVPFPVPQDDSEIRVSRVNGGDRYCHAFVRSLPACDVSAPSKLTPREQINSVTHFIDGSMVYHHDSTVQTTLIRNQSSPDGLLNVGPPVTGTSRPSLPFITEQENHDEIIACPNYPCFLAGDFRVNEHVSLTVMHTLWVREHNRIAQTLRNNNHMKSDEIFKTARNIVVAQIQKITYKDFLPILIGENYSDILPPYSGYNSSVNPNIPNAFATAAYRFGHSQIQPVFDRLDENYNPIPAGPLSLVDSFFNANQFIDNGGTDPIIRGLLTRNARKVDEFLNSILTNRLFSEGASIPGLDLASLNVQRGRDHGLPTYLTWKQWAMEQCKVESDFQNQLTNIHFLQTYGNLDNVDLFVGGLAEKRLPGGLVGAVFACIFGKTFAALRDGDRYYYENSAVLFSADQREEIEKASLSRVICDNSDITEIQLDAFIVDQNKIPCSKLPSVDLSKWKLPSVDFKLPKFCYIKENSIERRPYLVLSNPLGSNLPPLVSTRKRCGRFLCPEVRGRKTNIVAFMSYNCSVQPNRNLMTSNFYGYNNIYRQEFSAGDILPKNGLYTTLRSCMRGNAVALTFCGGGDEDLKEQEDEDVDRYINNDELREIYHNNGYSDKEIEKILPASEKLEKTDELISVMEDVLQQLKTHSPDDAESQTSSNTDDHIKDKDSTLSELEEALREELQ